MHKMVMVVTLLASIMFISGMEVTNVYAVQAAAPVTLTKEAESTIDYREEETVPDTGDQSPAAIAIYIIMLAGTIGAITVVTTAVSHKALDFRVSTR